LTLGNGRIDRKSVLLEALEKPLGLKALFWTNIISAYYENAR